MTDSESHVHPFFLNDTHTGNQAKQTHPKCVIQHLTWDEVEVCKDCFTIKSLRKMCKDREIGIHGTKQVLLQKLRRFGSINTTVDEQMKIKASMKEAMIRNDLDTMGRLLKQLRTEKEKKIIEKLVHSHKTQTHENNATDTPSYPFKELMLVCGDRCVENTLRVLPTSDKQWRITGFVKVRSKEKIQKRDFKKKRQHYPTQEAATTTACSELYPFI